MTRFVTNALSIAVSIARTVTCAHEDPRGDVHPFVVMSAGHFEVYYTDNRQENNTSRGPLYRTTFSPDGKLIRDRERFDGKVSESDRSESFQLQLVGEKPSFTITLHGERQARTIEPKLPLGAHTDRFLIGWLPERKVVMRYSPSKPTDEDKWPFSLGICDLRSGDLLESTFIGKPARIYDFARTSCVLQVDSDVVIAWMEEKRFPSDEILLKDGSTATIRNSAFRVVVTRWQPKLQKTLHTIVAPALNGNVSISIGQINNLLLVAWHELGKIRIRTVDLNAAPFVARLPELKRQSAETEKEVRNEIFGVTFER